MSVYPATPATVSHASVEVAPTVQRIEGMEYTEAFTLGMGDYFRRDRHGKTYGPINWVDDSVDGTARFVETVKEGNTTIHPFQRVYVTRRAPRCECGRRYEYCEEECPWPQELEDVYARRV
ncbi:hypothetical protein [Streptomyces massasporeus]|uniref:hypothetical protein n=1 Tax=Streptomyces massasporeus TaxID=67324 RepID=UPI0033249477